MKTTDGSFVGYAWGGPVVGWVQFNPTLAGGGNPDVNCPGCGGGGSAPVVAGSCSAITPYQNVAPNTSVTFKATATSGTSPYQYRWNGAASTTIDQFTVSYPSSGSGPIVSIGDSTLPVKGYSGNKTCPNVTVLQPLGPTNLHINKGTTPPTPPAVGLTTLNINQNTVTPFNINWDITLTNDYSCSASISNDPNLANWNAAWKDPVTGVVLNASNGTDNGDGTITWKSSTGGSLTTPISGLPVGSYQFKLTCTGGAMGTQTTGATLRVTSTSENEI